MVHRSSLFNGEGGQGVKGHLGGWPPQWVEGSMGLWKQSLPPITFLQLTREDLRKGRFCAISHPEWPRPSPMCIITQGKMYMGISLFLWLAWHPLFGTLLDECKNWGSSESKRNNHVTWERCQETEHLSHPQKSSTFTEQQAWLSGQKQLHQLRKSPPQGRIHRKRKKWKSWTTFREVS